MDAPNGRWHTTAGGTLGPALRLFAYFIIAANILIGLASLYAGVWVNGLVMFVVALFVIWTLWDDNRDRSR